MKKPTPLEQLAAIVKVLWPQRQFGLILPGLIVFPIADKEAPATLSADSLEAVVFLIRAMTPEQLKLFDEQFITRYNNGGFIIPVHDTASQILSYKPELLIFGLWRALVAGIDWHEESEAQEEGQGEEEGGGSARLFD